MNVLVLIIIGVNFSNLLAKDVLQKDEEEKLHSKGYKDVLSDENALKESLSKVLLDVDKDNDKRITVKEMKHWFDSISMEATRREFEQRWVYLENAMKAMKKSELNWITFNSITNPASETEKQRKRWGKVDKNKDGVLSKAEFFAFMYPRFTHEYRGLEIHEFISMFDVDSDKKLNFPEFYRFIIYNRRREMDPYTPSERQGTEAEYRGYFDAIVDANKDGLIDFEEFKNFMFGDQGYVVAQHLMNNHDEDKNGALSIDEILKSPRHFTRLLPHEFWDAMHSKRDEL